MNIIKTLKSSISEKGNYCYSLPVETTKEIIKDVEQLQRENQKYKEVIDKAIEYTEEHRINNPYHYEYNCFMGNARASDLLDILKEVE